MAAVCPLCGALNATCGGPTGHAPGLVIEDQTSRKAGGMALKEYDIPTGTGAGRTTTLLLSDEDAKAAGLTGGRDRGVTPPIDNPAGSEVVAKPVSTKLRTASNK